MNATEYAILGLLAEEPRTGYDIKKEVEVRLSHFWSQSYGHIYPMLRRLAERGLVRMEVQRQADRPDRKVYSITDDGGVALRRWFEAPPGAQPPRNELLLRIFMGRHAEPRLLARDVQARGRDAAARLAALRDVQRRIGSLEEDHPDRAYWELTIQYGLLVLGAIEEWAQLAEEAIDAMGDG